jgi:hypothetical protein
MGAPDEERWFGRVMDQKRFFSTEVSQADHEPAQLVAPSVNLVE